MQHNDDPLQPLNNLFGRLLLFLVRIAVIYLALGVFLYGNVYRFRQALVEFRDFDLLAVFEHLFEVVGVRSELIQFADAALDRSGREIVSR